MYIAGDPDDSGGEGFTGRGARDFDGEAVACDVRAVGLGEWHDMMLSHIMDGLNTGEGRGFCRVGCMRSASCILVKRADEGW
jgi:hypothetical protein